MPLPRCTPPVQPANPKCYACSRASLVLQVDPARFTLGALVSKVLQGKLGANLPSLTVGDSLLYEAGDDLDPSEVAAYARKLLLPLASLAPAVAHGACLQVDDYGQDFQCQLLIHVRAALFALHLHRAATAAVSKCPLLCPACPQAREAWDPLTDPDGFILSGDAPQPAPAPADPLLWRLVPALVREMGQAYPELVRAETLIAEVM